MVRFVVVLAGALVLAACLEGTAAPDEAPFSGSAGSLELLGKEVLHALSREDTLALERFRLTEEKHNRVVWPELPAADPQANYPVDFAWSNIQMRNARALSRLLPLFAGTDPMFEAVGCRGGTRAFETFRVHTDCWIRFTLPHRPGTLEVQVFKDVLVRAGGFKVFRYYGEPPRPVHAEGGR